MPRIIIRSPEAIRGEVNSVKQANNNHGASSVRGGRGGRSRKRCAVSTDLVVDFAGQARGMCNTMDAADLAVLIGGGPGDRLESLSLEKVRVTGDWSLVLDALRNAPAAKHLRTFSSYSCIVRDDPEDMVQLGEALATLPALESVSFGFSGMKSQPAWRILTPVVSNCERISKIFVNGFYGPEPQDEEKNQQVVQFLNTCARSESLQRLLCLPMLGRAFGPPVMDAVANLVRTNNSLHTLELYILNGASVVPVAQALQTNSTLNKLALTGRRDADEQAEKDAFYECFKHHNYTLKELNVEPWSANDHYTPLQFELALNRMGREHLFSQRATTDDWLDAIADKDSVSFVYYFLRKNPSLCDPKIWATQNQQDEEYDSDEYSDDVSSVASFGSYPVYVSSPQRPPPPEGVRDPYLSDAEFFQALADGTAYCTMQDVAAWFANPRMATPSPAGTFPRRRLDDRELPTTPPTPPTPSTPPREVDLYSRKRSRDQMEYYEDDSNSGDEWDHEGEEQEEQGMESMAPPSSDNDSEEAKPASTNEGEKLKKTASSVLGVVSTTAYTAAVFAAGYFYRGMN